MVIELYQYMLVAKEINKIPTSEMTQVSSKEVASSPELFHMDRVTCELGNRPLFACGFHILPRDFLYPGDNGVGNNPFLPILWLKV